MERVSFFVQFFHSWFIPDILKSDKLEQKKEISYLGEMRKKTRLSMDQKGISFEEVMEQLRL